ncbi:pilus assembly protein CpaE [Rubricella aquisinus]|uniref:Pilus assembly protein CpaE n=1 Tax=Rubricella aquisinus TaxID=2028108 RepID=A0A840WZP6_9RHOB|nr:AAA family ATPase [Rubricella aquisinus]MBB5515934.1 pilus assembly protein CpaE [Rubricella aquisinus]
MALLRGKSTPAPEALAVATHLEDFDLLMEDLDEEFGTAWQSVAVGAAFDRIAEVNPEETEILVIAVEPDDEPAFGTFADLIKAGQQKGMAVLLVVDEVSPRAMHTLMRAGADDFTPYPLPEGVLSETIRSMRGKVSQKVAEAKAATEMRQGVIMPVYGVAGGVGATTFAVNLAWEIALELRKTDKRVAIIDLDLQYGTVSTYLELQRREAIYELLSSPENMDRDSVKQAIQTFNKRLDVFTAPPDALPLDFMEPETLNTILDFMVQGYDFIVVNVPSALTRWSDIVLTRAETYFAVMETDMRSADNMLRFLRALKAEDLPFEKIQYVLNRAPGLTDMSGRRSRMKRLAETLGIEFNVMLPDGGSAIPNACDHGKPLAEAAARNPLRKEINKTAISLIKLVESQKSGTI